ncbi:MAG: radical SAM protein [Oscillospiraceae bacterium]|nr:radical SAM protein [Oscillospiraceae bacterium]
MTSPEEKRVFFPTAAISRLRMATDGEGVTTLVCACGCPLRCAYCINKFTWDESAKVNRYTPQELYDKVKLDSLYFEATGGGVTFGGGEPLLYADFFPQFRALCGTRWKLYAETSLCVPESNVRTAAQVMDGFIVDVKDTDPDIYLAYTGKEVSTALNNLRLLAALTDPARIRVRLPLIPGYNTDENRKKSEAILRDMGITDIDRFNYVVREG